MPRGKNGREGDAFALGEVGELIEIRDGKVFQTFGHGRSGVARGHEHLFHAGTLRKAPGEGVFTAAVADNEKLHTRLRKKRVWEKRCCDSRKKGPRARAFRGENYSSSSKTAEV